jgi:hypothetical protein
MAEWEIEFYEDESGVEPVLRWLRKLPRHKRRAAAAALEQVLARQGIGICQSGWGKWVKGVDGIFELRVRQDYGTILRNAGVAIPDGDEDDAAERHGDILLRIFCHAYGKKVVLLLAGYDKGESPGDKRQNDETAKASKRLDDWKKRQQAAAKAAKRTGGGRRKRNP